MPDKRWTLPCLPPPSLSWGFVGGLLLQCSSAAAPPTLEQFHPATVTRGLSNHIVAVGSPGKWPPQVWVSHPGIQFLPRTNTGAFGVIVASNTPSGPHLVRLHNNEGASIPRIIVVTDSPDAIEAEPNDDRREPQPIAVLPTILSGRLEKSGDVDSYEVVVGAGRTLVARLDAYVLASPLDAVIRIVDSRGVQLALNHDDGMTFDPWVSWTAGSETRVVVQVFGFPYPAGSDVRFHGCAACVYRLHLSTGPWVRWTTPLGVSCLDPTQLILHGWNLDATSAVSRVPKGLTPRSRPQEVQLPGMIHPTWMAVGSVKEVLEPMATQSNRVASRLEVPSAVTGCIEAPGEIDRYRFPATKGSRLQFTVQSESFGFPLDAVLQVQDDAGKELARSDDTTGRDPALEWTAPSDGDFQACVHSLLRRGGPDHVYRLSIEHASPGFRPRSSVHQFALKVDSTNDITFSLGRFHAHAEKLRASLSGLPPDVRCDPVDVDEKAGEAKLKCIVPKTAAPFSGPIRGLVARLDGTGQQEPVYELVTSGSDNGVPNGFQKLLVESTPDLWLTILPPEPASK